MAVTITHGVRTNFTREILRPADTDLFCREEAASILGISVSTLAHRARAGDGPSFVILGRRSWYRGCDLQAWAEAQTFSRRRNPK